MTATPTLGGSPAELSLINGSGAFPEGLSSETTFRAIAKTSFSEDGILESLGGSFAPGVMTEYRGVSSSRSVCALVPSSQLWHWMRLEIYLRQRRDNYLLCELSARSCLTAATWSSVRSARMGTKRTDRRRSKKKIVMVDPLWAFGTIEGCGGRRGEGA